MRRTTGPSKSLPAFSFRSITSAVSLPKYHFRSITSEVSLPQHHFPSITSEVSLPQYHFRSIKSENILPVRQDRVQRIAEVRRRFRHVETDLGDVLLPALHDLVAELRAQCTCGQKLIA